MAECLHMFTHMEAPLEHFHPEHLHSSPKFSGATFQHYLLQRESSLISVIIDEFCLFLNFRHRDSYLSFVSGFFPSVWHLWGFIYITQHVLIVHPNNVFIHSHVNRQFGIIRNKNCYSNNCLLKSTHAHFSCMVDTCISLINANKQFSKLAGTNLPSYQQCMRVPVTCIFVKLGTVGLLSF